ncbi:cl-channel voltage-gated family protein [Clostridium sp. CAG:715]|nr:cl-channel voltage-gated family protein [Clostridium sp. CAG:715]
MGLSRKIFQKTGYFLQEIARSKIILQAVMVGLISGLLVVFFKVSINKLFEFIQNFISQFDLSHKLLIFPLITTLGGLISGVLVFKFAPETKGSGIPFVKMVMARMGNITRVRTIVVKFLAGVAGIGTGLSLGREGPSVQLGAGAGALVGKIFKMKGTDQGKLIAAGAGSAIGATFNAPIAGTIFVLEELVNKFSASLLFPVLVATVTASSVARHFLGNNPSFTIPYITHDLSFEGISVCIILGIVAGFLGVAFAKIIYKNNEFFEKMDKIPNWLKPAIAGFGIGVIGIFIPYVLGSGNLSVDLLLQHKLALSVVVLVFAVKFFVTPFCFGSGAAGGIFLPMLMLGSFLGYIVASIFNMFGFHVDVVVMAMIGMGAFLASVARTPITAVVMVFEMTAGYTHILPIMLSAAIADLIAEKLNHRPIYASLIVNQVKSPEAKLLSSLLVKNYMKTDLVCFSSNMTISMVQEKIKNYSFKTYPVKNDKNKLLGLITKSDIEDAIFQGVDTNTEINKLMNPSPVTIEPSENLYIAYFRLHSNNAQCLVVVDKNNKIKGLITRQDINKAI